MFCVVEFVMVALSDSIWEQMFIMHIKSKNTTTRSSKAPRIPQRCSGITSNGEVKHMMVPKEQMATLRKKSHTRPPKVKIPRMARLRSSGMS